MFRDVHRQTRLAHRRASRHDDKIAGLQSGSHAIQIRKAARHARNVVGVVPVVEHVDALYHLGQQRRHFLEPLLAARALLRNFENLRLCLVQHLVGVATHRVVGRIRDLGGDFGELPQNGAVTHDLGIPPYVGGRRRVGCQRTEIWDPAGGLQILRAIEALRYRNDVGRPRVGDQLGDMAIDQPMVGAVEIRLGDQIRDPIPRRILQQQSAQHRLLRLDRVRRKLDQLDLIVLQYLGQGHMRRRREARG